MTSPETNAELAALSKRIHEAGAMLAAGREALSAGRVPELSALAPMIDALVGDVARIPSGQGRVLRPALMALLDEVAVFSEQLLKEHRRVMEQLRDASTRAQAGEAYQRSAKR